MEIPQFNDPEDIARRFEREQRGVLRKREEELSESLSPYRVGSVPYLNAVPLTRGLESEIVFATPSKLAEMLRRDELDAALVSVTEVLFNDRYNILDGVAVASLMADRTGVVSLATTGAGLSQAASRKRTPTTCRMLPSIYCRACGESCWSWP